MADSRYSFLGGTKKKSKGSRESVEKNPKNEPTRVLRERNNEEPTKVADYDENVHAVVGASVTVGMSTKFMSEKIEISCWESRPCADNPHDRARVKGEIKDDLTREALEMLDANIREFFPEMLEGKG